MPYQLFFVGLKKAPFLKKLLLLFFCTTVSHFCRAQVRLIDSVIAVNAITESISALDFTKLFIDSNKITGLDDIPDQLFTPLELFEKRKKLPIHLITKPAYLQVSLINNGALPDSIYFYPGFLFSDIDLYKKTIPGHLELLHIWGSNTGYPGFVVPPNEKMQLYVRLQPCKTDFINFNPQFIAANFLPNYKRLRDNQNEDLKMVGFILSGILLMMIFFTAANFFLTGKKEFLYYCLYSFCMFGLIFLYALLYTQPNWLSALFRGYFDFFMLLTGTIFYIAFTRNFLNTRMHYAFLNKLFKGEEYFLISLLLIYSYIHFFTSAFWLENFLENSMKFISLAIGVVYVAVALAQRKKLLNYLALGNASLIIFSGVSLSFIWLNIKGNSVYYSALFYYDIGLVLALISFLFGLIYKNREELIEHTKRESALKQETEKKEFENQLALLKAQQEERNRISADMHDDLGAGMTSIRLYSELAKSKFKNNEIPEIDKISTFANELLDKMNAIIWSMSSANDTFENTTAYVRSYAQEYFENTGINCVIHLPDPIPYAVISGKIRRNIFLVVKEALNNIVKHSGATQVTITVIAEGKTLKMFIHDNGRGIDLDNLRRFGNGLKNMKKRMDDVKVNFTIENKNGTLLTFWRDLKE
jgi:signal transduction histidine kinase